MDQTELLDEISKLLIKFGDVNNTEMNHVTCTLSFRDDSIHYFNGEKFLEEIEET